MKSLSFIKSSLWCSSSIVCAFLAVIPVSAQVESKGVSYKISDGSEFTPKDFYPKFSWDVTPQYFMFGTPERLLSGQEVGSIARKTDFLCIEKSHGMNQLGYAELGAKHEVAAFKKVNPDAKVLFYFNSAYAYPFTSYSKLFELAKIDRNPRFKSFLLIDPETNELARRGSTLCFDVLNPKFRGWWVNTVARGLSDSDTDGVFIDQMHGFNWMRLDRAEEVKVAMGKMMEVLKKKMPADKILVGNNTNMRLAEHVYPHVDAVMFEHYEAKFLTKEALLRDWRDMLKIAKDGKMSIFRIGVEYDPDVVSQMDPELKGAKRDLLYTELSKKSAEYHLACYLIGAQPYSYFQYGWGWRLSTGSLVDYPDFHKPLGKPKGAYKRTEKKKWEFTREFEHASVWVDTEKREAKITWRKPKT